MKCTDLSRPALLEQAAEECTELAKACLKLARIYRGENPTPVTEVKAIDNLEEETADVFLSMAALNEVGYCVSYDDLYDRMVVKLNRWNKRLEEKYGN